MSKEPVMDLWRSTQRAEPFRGQNGSPSPKAYPTGAAGTAAGIA